MRKLLFVVLACLTLQVLRAQNPENQKPFIEVTGTGEIEIVPDEIYVTILLQESKEKETLSKQEDALQKAIKDLGIDPKNLTLNSADADYGRYSTFKKEVILSKSYILKLSNATILSQVYEKLDKINAQDAYVSRIDHSKILEYTKEARIKAIKAAKEKAEYLLTAIGQQAGKPIQVLEIENYIHNPVYRNMAMKSVSNAYMREGDQAEEPEMSFRKIKIKSSFNVKFEIR